MDRVTYTTDEHLVVEVWWGFPTDILYDYDPEEFQIDLPDHIFTGRVRDFSDQFNTALFETFPNLQAIRVEWTGWGGNFAQFSPRALCEDEDLIYEPFFDVVQRLQDEAAEIAISANPWDYEIEYADMLSEHEEEKIADYQRERDRDG